MTTQYGVRWPGSGDVTEYVDLTTAVKAAEMAGADVVTRIVPNWERVY